MPARRRTEHWEQQLRYEAAASTPAMHSLRRLARRSYVPVPTAAVHCCQIVTDASAVCSAAGVGNVGNNNDGSHNLGSNNLGSRNVGDFNLGSGLLGRHLQGYNAAGLPVLTSDLKDTPTEPTKEEL